jgi:hypothetical protein
MHKEQVRTICNNWEEYHKEFGSSKRNISQKAHVDNLVNVPFRCLCM